MVEENKAEFLKEEVLQNVEVKKIVGLKMVSIDLVQGGVKGKTETDPVTPYKRFAVSITNVDENGQIKLFNDTPTVKKLSIPYNEREVIAKALLSVE